MSKGKMDISIKEVSYNKKEGLKSSKLVLVLAGKDLNVKMVNALRRISTNNIPIYAFPQELIKIETNTCVAFNNDEMRLRLAQLPIYNIDPDIFMLPNKYWKNINYADQHREKHPNEKSVELYVNSHNNSDKIQSITTNDIRYYIDGEQTNPYDKEYPILLIKLRPNDTFKCYMKGTLGTGDKNTIWCASSNSYYDISDKGDFRFTIQSCGQFDEFNLLSKTCQFVIKKMEMIKLEIERRVASKEIPIESTIYFNMEDEDHTIGELINYEFQSHKDIIFSGVSKPDHLVKTILLKISANKGIPTPIEAMNDCLDNISNKFKYIDKLLSEMKKKHK